MGRFVESLSDTTGYEAFRYIMQDSGSYYIGAKYTLGECMDEELCPFKFRAVIEHYMLKDTEPDTLFESQLYYLTSDKFSAKTYKQLKAKVKISILTQKKRLFKKEPEMIYEERVISIEDLCDMNLAKKKGSGVIIRELIISKLALMSFSV